MCPHAQIREGRKKIRCVLVHAYTLLRQGLRRLLEDEPDLEVVAEGSNAAEGLRLVFEHRPDIVIIDTSVFDCEPRRIKQLIREECPASKVLLYGGHEAGHRLIDGTGQPQVTRQTSAAEFVEMLRTTCTSQSTFSHSISPAEFSEFPVDEVLPKQRSLTAREREVLKLLAEGRTVRSVASVLHLSVKTVDAHKFNLMRKLGVHNKAELVMWAIQKNVVKPPVNF